MSGFYRLFVTGLVGAALSLASGCAKKTESAPTADAAAVQAAQAFPEGTNILAALGQKDYEAAVSGLAKLRDTVNGGEQENQFATLKMHVKNHLIEASATDPKAADALNALRLLTQGR